MKIRAEYFESWLKGHKRCEIRANDRGFKVGDELVLREWDGKKYTGRAMKTEVLHIDDIQQTLGLYDAGHVPKAIGLPKTKKTVQLVGLSLAPRGFIRKFLPAVA